MKIVPNTQFNGVKQLLPCNAQIFDTQENYYLKTTSHIYDTCLLKHKTFNI